MRFTIVLVIFAVIVVEFSSARFKCKPGESYKENDCNDCLCSDFGNLVCSFFSCSGSKNEQLRNCSVGTITQNGCNTCTCEKGLGTICTADEC